MLHKGPQILKDSWGGEVEEMPHEMTRAAAGWRNATREDSCDSGIRLFGKRDAENGERVYGGRRWHC